jgi:hypothetical protein
MIGDIIVKNQSSPMRPLNFQPSPIGFPKPVPRFTGHSKTAATTEPKNQEAETSAPSLTMTKDDLLKLSWIEYEETIAAAESSAETMVTVDLLLKYLDSSYPRQIFYGLLLMQKNQFIEESLDKLVLHRFHIRLSVLCSSPSIQIQIESWKILAKILPLSHSACEDIASIPEFIQSSLRSNHDDQSLSSPETPINKFRVLLCLLSVEIDEIVHDSVLKFINRDLKETAILQANKGDMEFLLECLRNIDLFDEIKSLVMAGLAPILISTSESSLSPVVIDCACEALHVCESHAVIDGHDLNLLLPSIASFLSTRPGVTGLTRKLISLVFRNYQNGVISDLQYASVIQNALGICFSRSSIQNKAEICIAFNSSTSEIRMPDFINDFASELSVDDFIQMGSIKDELCEFFIQFDLIKDLDALVTTYNENLPFSMKMNYAIRTDDKILAVKLLKSGSSQDLKNLWKFMFNLVNGEFKSMDEVIEKGPIDWLQKILDSEWITEFYGNRFELFLVLCKRCLSSTTDLSYSIIVSQFNNLKIPLMPTSISIDQQGISLMIKLIETFNETGDELCGALIASFASDSNFPSSLRDAVWSDSDLVVNLGRSVKSSSLFKLSEEDPGKLRNISPINPRYLERLRNLDLPDSSFIKKVIVHSS